MGIVTGNTTTELRNSMGSEPNTEEVEKIKIEDLYIEEGPVKTSGVGPGNIWTVGVANVNSKIGINEIGFNGEFITINDGDGDTNVIRVISANNTFVDHFINEEFVDPVESSATISVGQVDLTPGQDLTSDVIYFDQDDVVNVRVQLFGYTDISNFEIEVSTDNKFSWSEVTHNTSTVLTPTIVPEATFPLTFPVTFGGEISGPGNKMYYRVINISTTDSEQITDIKVFYNE